MTSPCRDHTTSSEGASVSWSDRGLFWPGQRRSSPCWHNWPLHTAGHIWQLRPFVWKGHWPSPPGRRLGWCGLPVHRKSQERAWQLKHREGDQTLRDWILENTLLKSSHPFTHISDIALWPQFKHQHFNQVVSIVWSQQISLLQKTFWGPREISLQNDFSLQRSRPCLEWIVSHFRDLVLCTSFTIGPSAFFWKAAGNGPRLNTWILSWHLHYPESASTQPSPPG